jgi:hypothetical protein
MNRFIPAALLMILAWPAPASAHRLDEYLQAMRVDVRADGIVLELDLTPGAMLAPEVVAEIESDGADAYIAGVMRSLQLTIDGRESALMLKSAGLPPPDELLTGSGVVRLVMRAETVQRPGSHRLRVENGYQGAASVYLANALRPESPAVTIASQVRDPRQQSLTIDYVVGRALVTRGTPSWTVIAVLLLGGGACWRRIEGRRRGMRVVRRFLLVAEPGSGM